MGEGYSHAVDYYSLGILASQMMKENQVSENIKLLHSALDLDHQVAKCITKPYIRVPWSK